MIIPNATNKEVLEGTEAKKCACPWKKAQGTGYFEAGVVNTWCKLEVEVKLRLKWHGKFMLFKPLFFGKSPNKWQLE